MLGFTILNLFMIYLLNITINPYNNSAYELNSGSMTHFDKCKFTIHRICCCVRVEGVSDCNGHVIGLFVSSGPLIDQDDELSDEI